MICKHQMHLINQGIHWCELQKECYPNCDGCADKEEPPTPTIVVSDWLTRGITEKKLAKEKTKAIKKNQKLVAKHTEFRYKGFHTTVEWSREDAVFHGKIEDIPDLVSFECVLLKDAKKEFHKAVNDYLKFKRRSKKSGSL